MLNERTEEYKTIFNTILSQLYFNTCVCIRVYKQGQRRKLEINTTKH